jgi:hypothetical protein
VQVGEGADVVDARRATQDPVGRGSTFATPDGQGIVWQI